MQYIKKKNACGLHIEIEKDMRDALKMLASRRAMTQTQFIVMLIQQEIVKQHERDT